MQRLQSYATLPMDRGFEGFDLLTNLTEDIPDFWGTIDPSLTSDALPLHPIDTPPLPTPLGSNYLLTGGTVASNFSDSLFSATPGADELVSFQDLAILYRNHLRDLIHVSKLTVWSSQTPQLLRCFLSGFAYREQAAVPARMGARPKVTSNPRTELLHSPDRHNNLPTIRSPTTSML
jgi:hypothetical protein